MFQSTDDAANSSSPRGADTAAERRDSTDPGETENRNSTASPLHVSRQQNLTGFSTKLEQRVYSIEKHYPDWYPRGTKTQFFPLSIKIKILASHWLLTLVLLKTLPSSPHSQLSAKFEQEYKSHEAPLDTCNKQSRVTVVCAHRPGGCGCQAPLS